LGSQKRWCQKSVPATSCRVEHHHLGTVPATSCRVEHHHLGTGVQIVRLCHATSTPQIQTTQQIKQYSTARTGASSAREVAALVIIIAASKKRNQPSDETVRQTRIGLASLAQIAAVEARMTVVREGQRRVCDAAELVPRDLVDLTGCPPGFMLPCDMALLSGQVGLNESNLTGESILSASRTQSRCLMPARFC
jgi:cation transport ATPase